MNPEINDLKLLSLLPDRMGEAGAECEIILPDYCPNILRILQATAHPTLHTAAKNADRLTVEGSVEFRILYLPEEGTGAKTISQQCPFSCSLDANWEDSADFAVSLRSRNCVARALNSRKIHARSSVQVTVSVNGIASVPMPAIPGDCEIKTCKQKAARLLCSSQKPLRISDDFETDPEKPAAEILQKKITFRQTEQKALTDKLIVKADMIFDLLCASGDGTVFPLRKVFPISQILDLPDLTANAVFRTEFHLLTANFTIRDEGADGSQTIGYDVEINVTGRAFEEISAEWAQDAYSIKKTVECTRKQITAERFLLVEETGTVRETAEVGTCTDLLWVDVTPELKGTYYKEDSGRTICEGVWECKVLMTDGEGTLCSATREIPFLLELPCDGPVSPVRNDTSLILTDLSWAASDATQIEIRGTYRWSGMIFTRRTAEAVVEIKEISDREKTEDTLLLYYASKGESAWKIAKEHACPYGELIRANALEEDELNEDKMLMILCC